MAYHPEPHEEAPGPRRQREKGEMCTRAFFCGFYGKDLAKQGNKYVQYWLV